MIRFMMPRLLLLSLVLITLSASIHAQVPPLINYQGRLTDAGGTTVADGSYQINFKVYGSAAGDDSLWWSGFQTITVTDGLFDYQLGSNNPLPADFFGPGSDPFLGIIVDTDPEITPRTPIVTSAFAFRANYADTAVVATIAQDITCYHCVSTDDIDYGCITSDKLAPNSITTNKIQNGTIQFQDIGTNGAVDGQIMKMLGGSWQATDDATGPEDAGDITAVFPGSGLTGGGESGDVTLSVSNYSITDVHLAANSVNSDKIENWSISGTDIGGNVVESGHIQNSTIVNSDISTDASIEPDKIRGTAVNLIDEQTIEGSKTFEDLNISTTTRRLAIPSSAFDPANQNYQYTRSSGALYNSASGSKEYHAPVYLPDGATVVQVKMTFYDTDAVFEGNFYLYKVYMATGAQIVMANEQSGGTPGYTTVVDSTITSETVSNDGYNYYMMVFLQYSADLQEMRLHGAEIVYTITRPLP